MSMAALAPCSVPAVARRDWGRSHSLRRSALPPAYSSPKLIGRHYVAAITLGYAQPDRKARRVTLDILRQTYSSQQESPRLPMQLHAGMNQLHRTRIRDRPHPGPDVRDDREPASPTRKARRRAHRRSRRCVWDIAGHHHDRVVPVVARRIQSLLTRRSLSTPAAILEFQDSKPLHDPIPAVRRTDARWAFRSAVARYGFPQWQQPVSR